MFATFNILRVELNLTYQAKFNSTRTSEVERLKVISIRGISFAIVSPP